MAAIWSDAEMSFTEEKLTFAHPAMFNNPEISWKDRLKMRVQLSAYIPPSIRVPHCSDPICMGEYSILLSTTVPVAATGDDGAWPQKVVPHTFVVMSRCSMPIAQLEFFPSLSGEAAQDAMESEYSSGEFSIPWFSASILNPETERGQSAAREIERFLEGGPCHQEWASRCGVELGPDNAVQPSAVLSRISELYEKVMNNAEPESCGARGCPLLHPVVDKLADLGQLIIPSQFPCFGDSMGLQTVDVFALDRATGMMVLIQKEAELKLAREGYEFSVPICVSKSTDDEREEAYIIGIGYNSFIPRDNGVISSDFNFQVGFSRDKELNDLVDPLISRKFFDDLFSGQTSSAKSENGSRSKMCVVS
jgi:hypothetical protein